MCASWKQSHAVSSFHHLWLQLYIFYPGQYLRVIVWCTIYGVLEGFRHINKDIWEVKHHVYVKWQTRIYTMWPSFLFTCGLLFIISTTNLVVEIIGKLRFSKNWSRSAIHSRFRSRFSNDTRTKLRNRYGATLARAAITWHLGTE